jgi:hypothetical protein
MFDEDIKTLNEIIDNYWDLEHEYIMSKLITVLSNMKNNNEAVKSNKNVSSKIENKRLKNSLKSILSIFTNLTTLYNSDAAYKEIKTARKLIDDKTKNSTNQDSYIQTNWFNVKLECSNIEYIRPCCRGGRSGIKIKLREVEIGYLLAELYELFGEDLLIDFIKNG